MSLRIPMIDSNLTHKDLTFFLTLMRTQSLSVAAQQMGLSVSAASRVLTRLREAFGAQLFAKSHDGLVPTHDAVELLPKIEKTARAYEAIFEEDVFDPAKLHRSVRIACSDVAAISILPKALGYLATHAPWLSVSVVGIHDDIAELLTSGFADFVIYPAAKLPPGLRSQLLRESPYRYIVREGHPLEAIYQASRRLTEEDLAPWSFVTGVLLPGVGVESSFVRETIQRSVPGRLCITTAHMIDIPGIVACSDLVSLLPETAIGFALASGHRITALDYVIGRPVNAPHIIWHERMDSDKAMQWVRSVIIHMCRKDAGTVPSFNG